MKLSVRACPHFYFIDKSKGGYNCNTNYYKIMRNIINISLPEKMAKEVDKEIRKENFSTKSEFFRMLVRLWLEKKLYRELKESRRELRAEKGKSLESLKDLR